MDKSSGNSDSRDMTLGCGPSTPTTSLSTALSSSSSSSTATSSSSASSSSSSSTMGGSSQAQSSSANSGTTLSPPPPPPPITLNITTTTGGSFTVVVDISNSVENLKKIIAKKLKVAKDRICLLHREKELQDGTLKENGLMEGSKIILIPNVETGLLAQRPENTVMQALESLNDSQVNDFLSGKTPLNLSMRLGDHMMLIQLQLSTVNPASPSSSSTSRSRSSQRSNRSSSNQTQSTPLSASSSGTSSSNNVSSHTHHHHHHSSASRKLDVDAATAPVNTSANTVGIDSNATGLSVPMSPALQKSIATLNELRALRARNIGSFLTPQQREVISTLTNRDFESLQSFVKGVTKAQQKHAALAQAATLASANSSSAMEVVNGGSVADSKAANCCPPVSSTSAYEALMEQSPIKSLSNLVSSPIKTTSIKNIPISSHPKYPIGSHPKYPIGHPKYTSELPSGSTGGSTACSDPISAKLTSCLCTRLNNSNKSCELTPCQSRNDIATADFATERSLVTSTPNNKLNSSQSSSSSASSTPTAASSTALLHKTGNNPIGRSKHRHHHHHHHHHHYYHHHGSSSSSSSSSSGSGSLRKSPTADDNESSDKKVASILDANDSALSLSTTSVTNSQENSSPSTSSSVVESAAASPIELDDSGITVTDTRTLAEASRNLTQTLRKLSKEVFTNKIDLNSEEIARKTSSGAVIESMKNHGKGIYSGTFSGTLNPALQDRYGRPKRDISTVIHILNDLLSATPQYSRGARISFEAPSTSSSRSKQASTSKPQTSSVSSESTTCAKCSGNSTCVYGECTGHYSTKAPTTPNTCADAEKTSSMCECTDLSQSTGSGTSCPSIDCTDTDERNLCKCRYLFAGEHQRGQMCVKCATDMVNNKTKFKLDQLRLVMQQRKQKREARKLKGAPYGARVLTTTPPTASASAASTSTASATASTIAPLASPSEVSPNHIVEEVDTAA